ncbi:MAG TPA: hypothetical protein VIU86_10000 [Gaiellaceae bacterium]
MALICALDARKMENEVRADTARIVRQLSVAPGRAVASRQTACRLE